MLRLTRVPRVGGGWRSWRGAGTEHPLQTACTLPVQPLQPFWGMPPILEAPLRPSTPCPGHFPTRTGCLGSAPCAPAPAQNQRTKGPGSSLANQSQGSASVHGEGREAGSQEPWEKAAVPRHARGKAGWCCREPAVSQPRSPALGTASEVPADPRSGTVGRQRCVAGEDKSGVRFQKG